MFFTILSVTPEPHGGVNLTRMFQAFEFRNEFWCFILPIALMAVDIVTGLLGAWAKRVINSSKLRTGLSKKVGEIAILVLGELFSFAMKLPEEVMEFLAFYIILMEAVSVIENLGKMNIPVPKFVSKALEQVNKEIQNADTSDVVDAVKEAKKDDSSGED